MIQPLIKNLQIVVNSLILLIFATKKNCSTYILLHSLFDNRGQSLEKSWDIGFSAAIAVRERSSPLFSFTYQQQRSFSKPEKMDVQSQIREAEAFDHFARITDDVLLSIVSRLGNLKHMCQCSLVSKRFASTIHKIQAVSLTLPSTEIPSDARADDINELFPNLAGFTSEEAVRFIQSSSLQEMKFFPFLGNFRRLKSISLEFACANCLCSSSLFKMRVKFSKRGGVVEKFVSIVADYVRKVTERGYDDGRVYGPRKNDAIVDTFLPFGCCTNWLLALCLLIKCQPSLERIAITNDKKQGKLVLEDEQLVAWRNSFVPGGLLNDFRPYAYTDGWVSALRIPSGYLLKGVNVMVAKSDPEPTTVVEDDDDAMTWEYPGEKRLLDDAVGEYLRRYPDAFMESQFAD